jgi:hypothetical protein
MDNNVNNILLRYNTELIDYKYCDKDDIINIPLGSNIIYFSKKNLLKKNGLLKNIKDNTILELKTKKYKWYIYVNEYYIFYKISNNNNNNKLRDVLKCLVNNNFVIKK